MSDPFVKGEIHEKVIQSVWWGVRGIYRFELLPENTIVTAEKILELGWQVPPHPPYSTDQAPTDYYLFRSLQYHLEEKHYDDRDHLENDLRAFFASKSPEFYARGVRDIVRRWQKVVDVDVDYFVE
ncbi:hypothetical protein RB195_011447 [Necator americanus]|uniref:Histone-lysine N-methyltransferase SETMAR n=1 Tax=Necator americanus TaxID=51031 RepID=A0ABR1D395_NECAM